MGRSIVDGRRNIGIGVMTLSETICVCAHMHTPIERTEVLDCRKSKERTKVNKLEESV